MLEFASFHIRRVVLLRGRQLAPWPADACPAALAKNKRFVSSRNTWSDHVAKISAIPLNNSFQKNYEDDFMSDQAGRLIFPKIAFD